MIPRKHYVANLLLVEKHKNIKGDIVECGVWKGGMVAGIAHVVGTKKAHLFDSFEGLPIVQDIDGDNAKNWQRDTKGKYYFNNCSADESFARKAMSLTNVEFQIHKGWFKNTLNDSVKIDNIAILRLDADLYESTMDCLNFFYKNLSYGGLILIDDYFSWEGCSKAIHDFLVQRKSKSKIRTFNNRVAYIVKVD